MTSCKLTKSLDAQDDLDKNISHILNNCAYKGTYSNKDKEDIKALFNQPPKSKYNKHFECVFDLIEFNEDKISDGLLYYLKNNNWDCLHDLAKIIEGETK